MSRNSRTCLTIHTPAKSAAWFGDQPKSILTASNSFRGIKMTNRETLLALADRVEAMDGPDRAVDAEIHIALFFPDWRLQTDCLPFPDQVRKGRIQEHGGCGWRRSPEYTASLDAAMRLCPDGFCVWAMGQIPDDCCFYAELWRDGSTKSEGEIRSSSLAQALVAACLRAHAGGE